MLATIFVFACIGFVSGANNISYYKNLWLNSIQEASSWQRPTENKEFKNALNQTCEDIEDKYDFIIVGAGSAGSVLANRLSEISQFKILLLEAGEDEEEIDLMPSAGYARQQSIKNWGYLSTPQKYVCRNNINKQCNQPSGKSLGGSSVLSYITHSRGNIHDYDSLKNLESWSYKDVLPYFIKSENASSILDKLDKGYHGKSGPLDVGFFASTPPFLNTVIDGYKNLKLKEVDYNGKAQIGVAEKQANIRYGRRLSINHAYLKPISNRTNLNITTGVLVAKIYFTKENVAFKLKFLKSDSCYFAYANKEIIISAGTYNSPQLLMLSGIGPRRELEKLNITVLADLPVGKNFKNQVAINNIIINNNLSYPIATLDKAVVDYINGKGVLTYFGAEEVATRKVLNLGNPSVPDIQAIFFTLNNFIPPAIVQPLFPKNSVNKTHLCNNPNCLLVDILLLYPKSSGELTLKSANPIDLPIIEPNYLHHPDDRNTLSLGIQKILLDLLNTKTFKAINATLENFFPEECKHLIETKEYLDCVITYRATTTFLSTGTCRMGNYKKNSVVDHKLKVHGFKGLRVVDASVLPKGNSGFLNSVAIMIAEKISDDIKKFYKYD